jgi:hypothetical protein
VPIVPVAELEAAINRARDAQPARGHEGTLSPDVARLADLYGKMIAAHAEAFNSDRIDPATWEVFQRWARPPAA